MADEPLVTLGYKKGGENGYLTEFGTGDFSVYGGEIKYALIQPGAKLTLYSEKGQQGKSMTRRGPMKAYLEFDAYSYKLEKADPIDRAKDKVKDAIEGLSDEEKRVGVLVGLGLLVLLILNLLT